MIMPLNLPPETQQRLLVRFERAEAWAFRLVERVISLKHTPEDWAGIFRKTWEESADHHRLFLQGRLLGYAPWDEQEAEMVRQWQAFIEGELGEPAGDPQQLFEFHQLIGAFYPRFVAAGDAADPVATMSELIAEVSQAITDYGAVDKKGDLKTLLLNCIEVLSVFCEQRNDFGQAVAHANMATLKAEDFGRRATAMKNRSRSAKLLFAGSRNIDEALHLVLPIWEVVQDRPPSLDRANLACILAQGYAQTGDLTETRYFLGKIITDLETLGLGMTTEDSAEVLSGWLDLLPEWEPESNYTLERFTAGVLLHVQYASLRELNVPQPEGIEHWRQQRDRCLDMIEAFRHLKAHQEKVDECLVAGEEAPELAPISFERFDHAASTFGEWLKTMYRWFQEDDQDEALLKALYGKMEEEVVQKDIVNQMLIWQLIGEFHTGREETEQSEAALNTAYGLATEANRMEEQLHILKLMVGTYLGPDHANERLGVCLRAIDLTEKVRAEISTPYQRSAFVQDKYEFYALALKISWKGEAFDLMLGLIALVKANGYKEALLREGEDASELQEQLGVLHEERMAAAPEYLTVIARRRQTLYDTRTLRARGLRMPSTYRSSSFQRILDDLPEGEAVLNYCELIGGIWLFQLFAGGRFLAHEYRVEEAWLHDCIATYGRDLPSGYRGRGMAIYKPKYGGAQREKRRRKQKALAEWLLPEEFREALVGCRHLRVCPHHELHGVPFHALPFGDGYLIEAFAVSYLPNLNCLPLPLRKRSKSAAPVALIGTDQFAQIDGQALAPLPGALAEVNELAAFYAAENVPVLNYTGPDAQRKKILDPEAVAALEACRVVHLAVHGEDLSLESPMDARLFLRDGFIDGFDVSLLRLTAEVVVLSACFAGARPQAVRGYDELVADDMFGLQSAFFSAGAQSVLGALWPVDDAVGKLLMVDFHRYLREYAPADALRLATLDYLRAAPEGRRGSVYWGGFFLVVG
jgi:hypothetical protein